MTLSNRWFYLSLLVLILFGCLVILAPASGSPSACSDVPAGIVSWWPAEGTAEDVADGNDGTVLGATYAAGIVGEAFSLDGEDDYINIPDAPNLDGHSELTLEAWVRPDTLGWPNPDPDSDYEAAIISKYDSTQSEKRSFVFNLSDGRLKMVVFGTNYLSAIADEPVALDTWSHVAGVWDGNTIRLYVNGAEIAATISGATVSQTSDNDTPVNLGRIESYSGGYTGPAAFFDGLIDEASLYNRALSEVEINNVYSAGSDGKCQEVGTATATVSPTSAATGTPSPEATPDPDTHLPAVMKAEPTPTPTPTFTPTPPPTATPIPRPQLRDGYYSAELPFDGEISFWVRNDGTLATDGYYNFKVEWWCDRAINFIDDEVSISNGTFEFQDIDVVDREIFGGLGCASVTQTEASCVAWDVGPEQYCDSIEARVYWIHD